MAQPSAETAAMFLFDTSVFSTLLDPGRPTRLLYADLLRATPHFISFQTQAELWQGAAMKGWSEAQRERIRLLLSTAITLPSDNPTGEAWGALRAHAQKQGRRLGAEDAWVGATAIRNGLVLVTHDLDMVDLGFPGLDVVCRAPREVEGAP